MLLAVSSPSPERYQNGGALTSPIRFQLPCRSQSAFSPGVCAIQAQGPPSAPSAPGFPSFPQFPHVGRRSRAETIRTSWSVPNCRPWLREDPFKRLRDGWERPLITSPGNDGNRKPPNRLDWDAEQVETSPWDLQRRFSSLSPLRMESGCADAPSW